METIQMSAYTRPGIEPLSMQYIENMITLVFDFPNHNWVRSDCQEEKMCCARQLMMCCLLEFMDFNTTDAGAHCQRSHTNAVRSKYRVHATLMHDNVYGMRVRKVYETCQMMRRAKVKKKIQ